MSEIIKNTTPSELVDISNKIKELKQTGKKYYLSMDTETTGLSPDIDRLISLGAVLYDENFNEILRFETYFNPLKDNKTLSNRYNGSTAENITKITEKTLEGKSPLKGTNAFISSPALDFKEYASTLSDIFDSTHLIKMAHNKRFDMRMLETQFNASKEFYFTTNNQVWLDTQDIIKEHFLRNPEDKKTQEETLKEINKNKPPMNKITINTLDSFDIFISNKENLSQFERTINGNELHGALLDSLMLGEVVKKYNKNHPLFKELVKKEESNPKFQFYLEDLKRKENLKNKNDLVSSKPNKNTIPFIRTSASATTNKDTNDAIISSLRIEDLHEIFDNIISNGGNKAVISDFTSIANMVNIENSVIKYNEKQIENGKPTIAVSIGMCIFVKDENGNKTEIDLIPHTSEDFKRITEVQKLAFENDELEPFVKIEDLNKDMFNSFELITNGYRDLFNNIKNENKNEIISDFYTKMYKQNNKIKMGIYETNKILNDEKENILNHLNSNGINIQKVGTSIIAYNNMESHLIHEKQSGNISPIFYHNISDYDNEETSLYKNNRQEVNISFTNVTNENKIIPKDKVNIPNPFEFGLTFIKNNIPLLWERVERFNLIDNTKDLDNQDIENITKLYLRKLTFEGLDKRKNENNWTEETFNENIEAVEKELDVIQQMGFNGFTSFVEYFTNGEIKGKGRGSAAGSVVSYAIGITDIDPLPNGLLFERYLNLLRKGFPDIDMDFSDRNGVMERKLKPFLEIDEDFYKYILTISTSGIKGAIAEVCKNMDDKFLHQTGLLEGYVKGSKSVYVSKQILGKYFDKPGTKLNDVLNNPDFADFNELYNSNENIKKIVDIASNREGVITGYGIHAAGVILKTTAENYLNNGPIINGVSMTSIGGKVVEDYIGIKMDFLGLKSLTIIEFIKKAILDTKGPEELKKVENALLNYTTEVINDENIAQLLNEVNMGHIFQYSSELMKDIIRDFNITKEDDLLENLAMISAIGRPGVDSQSVIDNRKDPENNMKLVKEFPELKPILDNTYGEVVYEEQIMKIFTLFGFNMGEAGVAQKQIGKKKDLEKLKKQVMDVNPKYEKLFDHLVDNAGYSFNKSHAISYAVTSMMMMYLKANYKKEFFIGLLNEKINDKDKIPTILSDMKKGFNNIETIGLDINLSEFETISKNEKVYLGLGFAKGLNEKSIRKIIEDRKKNGNYKDLSDFLNRMSKSTPVTKEEYVSDMDLMEEEQKIKFLDKVGKKLLKKIETLQNKNNIEEAKTYEEEYNFILQNNLDGIDIIEYFKNNKLLHSLELMKPKTQKLGTNTLISKIAQTGALDCLVEGSNKLEIRKNILKDIDNKFNEISNNEILQLEKELTGSYLHLNHPLDNEILKETLKNDKVKSIEDLHKLKKDNKEVSFYGVIGNMDRIVSTNGNEMFRGPIVNEVGDEIFCIGMIDKLEEDSIDTLSNTTTPIILTGSLKIDENEKKTFFMTKAKSIDNSLLNNINNIEKENNNNIENDDKDLFYSEIKPNKKGEDKIYINLKQLNDENDYNKLLNKVKEICGTWPDGKPKCFINKSVIILNPPYDFKKSKSIVEYLNNNFNSISLDNVQSQKEPIIENNKTKEIENTNNSNISIKPSVNSIIKEETKSITVKTDKAQVIWEVSNNGTLTYKNWPNSNGKYYETDNISLDNLNNIIKNGEIHIDTHLRGSENEKIIPLNGSIVDVKEDKTLISLKSFDVDTKKDKTYNFSFDKSLNTFVCYEIDGKISLDEENLRKILNGNTSNIKCTKYFNINGETKESEGVIDIILNDSSIQTIENLCPHLKNKSTCSKCNPSQSNNMPF